MRTMLSTIKHIRIHHCVCLALLVVISTACNTVGPRTIKGARMNYNEAIARSWDQQLLLNLVRLRYRDTPLFLEINSVSTQYNLQWSTGADSSFFDTHGAARGLTGGASAATGVALDAAASASGSQSRTRGGSLSKQRRKDRSRGFDAGMSYAERPTVTYTPLQGQKFVTQLLSPVPLETLVLLTESGWSIERVLNLCLQRANDLDNASSASGPTPELVPAHYQAFREFAASLRKLQIQGALDFRLVSTDDGGHLAMYVHPQADAATLAGLQQVLGLSTDTQEFIVTTSRFKAEDQEVTVRTRSVLAIMYFLSQSVEPPERHESAGLVTVTRTPGGAPFDWSEIMGDLMRIRSQEAMPASAFVKVRYRGTWFYIDDTDLNSKTSFGLLSNLFYLQAGDIKSLGPTLTLPVGG